MSYKIITDSCCDFTEQQYNELGVSFASLTVLYNGENHSNFSDPAAVKAFYDELRSGVTASTAAATFLFISSIFIQEILLIIVFLHYNFLFPFSQDG